MNQSFTDLEIIIVNDDLTEKNPNVLPADIVDGRIRVIQNARTKGANGARNTGILECQGEYISFLDDDDEYLPQKLEEQVSRLQSLGYDWGGVYCGFLEFRNGSWITYRPGTEGAFPYEILVSNTNVCAGSTLLVRKGVFEHTGLFDESLTRHQDLEYLVRYFSFFKVGYIDKVLVKVYGHNTLGGGELINAKKKFLLKIRHFLSSLDRKQSDYFFSWQYRELAVQFFLDGKLVKGSFYFLKSLRRKVLPVRKYVRIFTSAWAGMKKALIQDSGAAF